MTPDFADLAPLQGQIAMRAQQDPTFRQALLSEPATAIHREFGISLPAGLKVKVVEQEPGTLLLVLPVLDALAPLRAARRPIDLPDDDSLSLDDLDQISAAGSGFAPPPHPHDDLS